MSDSVTCTCRLDRALFFQIGRALQRSFPKSQLGKVKLSVGDGHLWIESDRGGGMIPCSASTADLCAELTARAFCTLISTRHREKSPSGEMLIKFNPELKEVAIDHAGVRAKFLQQP